MSNSKFVLEKLKDNREIVFQKLDELHVKNGKDCEFYTDKMLEQHLFDGVDKGWYVGPVNREGLSRLSKDWRSMQRQQVGALPDKDDVVKLAEDWRLTDNAIVKLPLIEIAIRVKCKLAYKYQKVSIDHIAALLSEWHRPYTHPISCKPLFSETLDDWRKIFNGGFRFGG